jgi:rRNA maturation protein Nop10
MRKSIILIVGLVGAVNLQCADRGEDSKSGAPAPTSPRERYVQIKNIKDLEEFNK